MSSPAGTKACKTRCMQEMVLSLKGELRVTQDCLRATQERLEQQQRNAEELKKDQESCKEKLMLVGKKVGDDTTIAQDACIRSCKFSSLHAGYFFMFLTSKLTFRKYSFKNTTRMSNRMFAKIISKRHSGRQRDNRIYDGIEVDTRREEVGWLVD